MGRSRSKRSGARVNGARLATDLSPAELRQLADRRDPQPRPGQITPQPSLDDLDRRRFVDLTLADVVTTLWRAKETGDTHRLVDLWFQMLQTDDHLPSVWETRTLPVSSADWELVPAAGGEERHAEACTEALEQIPALESVFQAQLNALGVGYDAAEIVWGRGRIGGMGAWVPVKVEPIHARRFRFGDHYELGLYDTQGTAQSLRDAGWPVEEVASRSGMLIRLPAAKYIVHTPRTIADYPTGTGLVHSLARWWWVKQTVTKYWLGGAEFAGNARLIGKLPDNASDEVRAEMKQGLETLAALGVIILRGESSVEIVEGKGQSSGEVWDKLAKRMDAAMSKRVIGSTLNVEVGDTGGNRSLGESQDDVTISPRQKSDGDALWADWRRDLVTWIVKFNPHIFAVGAPVPHGRFIQDEGPPENVDQLLVDAGGATMDDLRRSRGLPEWGGERGARIARVERAAPAFSASEVAASDDPFPRPWARAALATTAATETSSRSRPTRSGSGR